MRSGLKEMVTRLENQDNVLAEMLSVVMVTAYENF